MSEVNRYIDMDVHALNSAEYREACKAQLDTNGVLQLGGFLRPDTLTQLIAEADDVLQNDVNLEKFQARCKGWLEEILAV